MKTERTCPKCDSDQLRSWRELDEEQQEVVRRLPGTAHYTIAERVARHRWCTICWHEQTGDVVYEA
ncbi:MAG: hypothetical protein WKF84_00165 [Pyrinomonadaceae bacterium]